MNRRPVARALILGLGLSVGSTTARAQTDPGTGPAEEEETTPQPEPGSPPPPEKTTEETSAKETEEKTVSTQAAPPVAPASKERQVYEPAPNAIRCHEEPLGHVGDHPQYRDHGCIDTALSWKGGFLMGGIELDVGYADYAYPEKKDTPHESLYDMRGRFTFGPLFLFELGKGYYLNAGGTLVGWVREQANAYQINVDDVFAEIGHTDDGAGNWDFKLGRFMTWRVYPKGLGFDLYTLEDNGPSIDYPISNENYLLHTYEVDYIYLRNSPYVNEVAGRAAIHYFPARFLGFELAGVYGLADARGSNTIGGRFAGSLHWRFINLLAGAEYRQQTRTATLYEAQNPGTPQEEYIECKDCAKSYNKGVGGGLVFKYKPIELGGAVAKGWEAAHVALGGADGGSDLDNSRVLTRMSYGGYLEFDPGHLVFKRSLILGVGYQNTEYIREDFNQRYLEQGVAYIAFPIFPLVFNGAMVKFVLSRSAGERYDPTDPEGNSYIKYDRNMTSGRFRFSTGF
jgi:hypothetical protein